MDDQQAVTSRRNRGGGREAKRAARAARSAVTIPYITRALPYYEVLDEQGLLTIERNADTILEEIGIDFRDDAEALTLWKAAGADVQGERVRFPRGLCRSLVQNSAPREFIQYARNPARNVAIGGKHTVFAPAYGSPFIRSLDEGRRYARSRTSGISSSSPTWRPRCTTPAARSASRSTCRSTSATSTWCTATSSTATSRSWAR